MGWRIMKESTQEREIVNKNRIGSIADMMQDNAPGFFNEYIPEAEILQKQIETPNVCNIAVSAAYGAGKSSVIKTYLELYRNRNLSKREKKELLESADNKGEKQDADFQCNTNSTEQNVEIRATVRKSLSGKLRRIIFQIKSFFQKPNYLRISLASFEGKKYDEDAVERSVLQQMLYSTSRKHLPKSKVERIDKTGILSTIVYALLLCSVIAGVIALSLHIAQKIVLHEELLLATSIITPLLILFFVVDLMYFGRLKHIKYKEFEVTLSDKDSKSAPSNLINKFLNEVLYFFECSKIDLVIFEDLDRLKCEVASDNNKTSTNLPLLVKLRELNTLINNSSKCKRKVTFVYAVKDDYFSDSEERAKFFDFILPIVPAINPNTAAEKLKDSLKKLDLRMTLSPSFVNEIAVYIPDMRTLTNTVNEYALMYKHLFDQDDRLSERIVKENLFALCLYKNLYAADYARLQVRKGGLIACLVDMEELNNKVDKEIDKKIELKEKQIEFIDSEFLKNFEELKAVLEYKARLTPRGGYVPNLQLIGNLKTFENVDFNCLQHPVYANSSVSFQNAAVEKQEFVDRELALKNKVDNKRNLILSEIDKLKIERKKSKHRSLRSVVLQDISSWNKGSDYCISKLETYRKAENANNFEVDQATEYLLFLIRRGYLDENYMDYISPHALGSLSANDMAFIRKIRAGEICYDYKLDDVKSVISNLADKDFSEMGMLHPLLMANLSEIKNIDKRHGNENLKRAVEVYSLQNALTDEIVLDFIMEERLGSVRNFFRYVLPECKSLVSEVLTSDADLEKKDLLLQCVIEFCDHYAEYNEDSYLKQYCESHSDYLNLFSVCTERKVLLFLGEIQPIFEHLLPYHKCSIYDKIVSENLFKLTTDNLLVALNLGGEQESFYKKNLALIKETSPSVEKYVRENLADYVRNVLLDANVTGEEEDENEIIDILKSDIDTDLKKQIIHKYNFCITDISEFSSELHQSVVANNKLEPSWSNINCVSKTIDFALLKEYMIINAESIYGEFNVLSNNDQIDLMRKFATSQLKDADIAFLLKAIGSIDKQVSLSVISGEEFTDGGLLLLLKNHNLQFALSDWSLIKNLDAFKKAYFEAFESEVCTNVTGFFSCGNNAQIIVSIALDKSIPVSIKQALFNSISDFNLTEALANELVPELLFNKIAIAPQLLIRICSISCISVFSRLDIIGNSLKRINISVLNTCLNHLGKPYSQIFTIQVGHYLEEIDNKRFLPILGFINRQGYKFELDKPSKQSRKATLHRLG